MNKISIRMLNGAAGRNLLLRKGQVIDDAPEAFMRSAVRTGIAEWVVSPDEVDEQIRDLEPVKPKRRRKAKK